jgi:TolB protein
VSIKSWLLPTVCIVLRVMHVEAQDTTDSSVRVQVTPARHEPLKMLIVGVGDQQLGDIATVVSKDVGFSGQFAPEIRILEKLHSRKIIADFARQGYPLVLFLTSSGQHIEWRLYDAMTVSMIQGKKYHKRGMTQRGWAHDIADAVWPVLTGHQSSFASKIAYCKEVIRSDKKRCTHIVIADYDGSNQQVVVATPTLHVAPRWNNDAQNPLLFYSQGTPSNIRLMCLNMQGKRKIASNFDGINMLPTFSGDGTKVVYCASKGHGNCQLYLFEKGIFKRLTHNDGNNVSPSLSKDGKILFYCSDIPTGKPQIYRYDLVTKVCKQITKGGFNFCPQYHINGKLVYTSLVGGHTQIFVYDQATDIHTQITWDASNKDECFWSACGSYLIFSVEQGLASRLALFNMHTQEQKYITSSDERCSYPCWSPLYSQFPVYA